MGFQIVYSGCGYKAAKLNKSGTEYPENKLEKGKSYTHKPEADVREDTFLRFTSSTLLSGKLETAIQEEKELNQSSESGTFQCPPDISEI